MKAFTERNPYLIGFVLLCVVGATTVGSLLLTGGVLKPRYTVKAVFADSGGVSSGTPVEVAGIKAGQVAHVGRRGTKVEIELRVDRGVDLPRDSTAQVVLQTVLGTKNVQITAGQDWQHRLENGDTIRGTSVPVDLNTLSIEGSRLFTSLDERSFNDLLHEVGDLSSGNADNLRQVLDGLDRLATVVDQRKGDAATLIDSARSVLRNLAANRGEISASVDQLNQVLANLVNRRTQLASLLSQTASVTQQLKDFLAKQRPDLDATLDGVHADLQILSRHQVDLAQTLADIDSALRGFGGVVSAGSPPQSVPWANFFAQNLGPLNQDALLGGCGVLDKLLDSSLGQDPLPCNERTGPSPYQLGSQSASSATAASGVGSTPTNPLAQLYDPLLGR